MVLSITRNKNVPGCTFGVTLTFIRTAVLSFYHQSNYLKTNVSYNSYIIYNYGNIRSTYSAYVRPGLQVFDGLSGQVLFVQLSVDLRQLRHPEPITVLPQDLPDATLDLLRVVWPSFIRAGILIQIQGCWRIEAKTQRKRKIMHAGHCCFF